MNRCLYYTGITNPYARFGILAAFHKESIFNNVREYSYKGMSTTDVRAVFDSQVNIKALSDPELAEVLKSSQPIEHWYNVAYKNLNGNGNYDSNDGYTYRGRGYLQLTGRGNYQAETDALKTFILKGPMSYAEYSFKNLNLITNPDAIIQERLVNVAISITFMLRLSKQMGFNWNDMSSKAEACNAAGVAIAGGTAGTNGADRGVQNTLKSAKNMMIQGFGLPDPGDDYPFAGADPNAGGGPSSTTKFIGGVVTPGTMDGSLGGTFQYGTVKTPKPIGVTEIT